MPTSSEFSTLCQSQVALLQGLGAALSIVYLTEELTATTDTQLVPVVAHPEAALNWGEEQIISFLNQRKTSLPPRLLSSESTGQFLTNPTPYVLPAAQQATPYAETYEVHRADVLLPQQQMVLPLIYQDRVMGLLITARADRAWSKAEQTQIEQIAQSLTLACVLDWRARWLTQDLQRQQLLEEQRTDLFDDLLHQFRNPLTALRTFGKLLVKRLRPGDSNRSVAESIVRESDRLQELLQQLDTAIDLDGEDLIPLLRAEPLESLDSPASETTSSQAQTSLRQAETRLLLGSAIDLQPHRIVEVLQPLMDSATVIAQDRQLSLEVNIPSNLPPVLIDVRALREVLNNLIDNALKYTPPGGQIYIGVQQKTIELASPHSAVDHPATACQGIVIADTGPGIPPEDLQHLFERHYRGVQASTNIPGTGLGLAIARDLVHQMQGDIQIFSPATNSSLVPSHLTTSRNNSRRPQPPGTAAVIWLVESDQ